MIEDFRGRDRKEIYRRFRDRGRLMPDGLRLHHSWISADMGRCFILMETDDVTLLQRWSSNGRIWWISRLFPWQQTRTWWKD
nr:DUF3303 family protein [Mesorhizobium sp.]